MERVDHEALGRFATALLRKAGLDEAAAETAATSLVAADVRGHPSHGVQMIPTYFGWMENGSMEADASPEVVANAGSTMLIDGNHALGHPVGLDATERAIERVESNPVVAVGIRKATHMGRIGWFAERAAEAGLGFAAFTNMTSGNPVAPAGSAQRRFGTNPLTFALPSFGALDYPILMDMATSQVAFGKINVRHRAGEAIDPSWTVAADGSPVLDADEFNEEEVGALAPLGGQDSGYKGTGLMLIAELFAATWSDSPVTPQPDARYENSAAFFVFDPLQFTTKAAHEARIEALEAYLDETEYSSDVSVGSGSGADRAYLPGRREHETRLAYEEEGIPIQPVIVENLVEFARERGVSDDVVDPIESA